MHSFMLRSFDSPFAQAMPYLNLKGRRVGFSKNTPQKIPFMQKWNFKEMGCGLHHGMLAQREQICFFVVYI